MEPRPSTRKKVLHTQCETIDADYIVVEEDNKDPVFSSKPVMSKKALLNIRHKEYRPQRPRESDSDDVFSGASVMIASPELQQIVNRDRGCQRPRARHPLCQPIRLAAGRMSRNQVQLVANRLAETASWARRRVMGTHDTRWSFMGGVLAQMNYGLHQVNGTKALDKAYSEVQQVVWEICGIHVPPQYKPETEVFCGFTSEKGEEDER